MIEPTTRSDQPHVSPTRRWSRRLAVALTSSLILVGPWPIDDANYFGSEHARRTIDRLDASNLPVPPGPIRVGLAEVDLTPGTPRPLAGFIGQIRTPFEGVDTPCFARALTVESASNTVTVLTADLLLINNRLARAIVDRAGVRPDQVYFTASHTHGGPGGWGSHPLEMLVAGAYDPAYFETLANQLAGVVRQSRVGLEPAELGFVSIQAKGRQKNRVDPALPTHDALSALIFRPVGSSPDTPPIAILTVFGAHATVSHPVPPRLGGDYPAALTSELKRLTGAGSVLFASGAVGDASPARPRAVSTSRSAEALGVALAGDLFAALPSSRFEREPEVASLRLEVDMPPVQLPFLGPRLRFGPALTWWIADRRTHLHALRLGPVVLVGFPGDYSGHLADALDRSTASTGLSSVATSFDGDFRGYLVSEPVFRRRDCYETRWMSFHGPWTGEYFNDLARRMVERLAQGSVASIPNQTNSIDSFLRIALGLLWMASLVIGRRSFRNLTQIAGPVAVLGVMSTSLAFVVDPDLVDWSKFSLPVWLRFVGILLGILALTRFDCWKPGQTAIQIGFVFALLCSSWLVVLMTLRGWAVSRLGAEPGWLGVGARVPAVGSKEVGNHQS